MIQFIKIILAILLLLCLFHFPYGYYQFVRIAATIGFVLLAYDAYEKGSKIQTIVYIGLAILFQPLIKVALGRTIWNIVDVIVTIMLLVSLLKLRRK